MKTQPVAVTLPDRGTWIVLEDGPERDIPLQVISLKPGARAVWVEMRAEDGRTWTAPADSLHWKYL